MKKELSHTLKIQGKIGRERNYIDICEALVGATNIVYNNECYIPAFKQQRC